MTVAEAHRAVTKAEAAIGDGERAREEAYAQLDQALAERGWKRMWGAFSSDARLYTLAGGNPLGLEDVLAHERRIAA